MKTQGCKRKSVLLQHMKLQAVRSRHRDNVVAHVHRDQFHPILRKGFLLWVLQTLMVLQSRSQCMTRHRPRSWSDGFKMKFMYRMQKLFLRCFRAHTLNRFELISPPQVRPQAQLLLLPHRVTNGAHALYVPEPCIHVVHQLAPTRGHIESGATTSTNLSMASACAGTLDCILDQLKPCRKWCAPSEHLFWEIFRFILVKTRCAFLSEKTKVRAVRIGLKKMGMECFIYPQVRSQD